MERGNKVLRLPTSSEARSSPGLHQIPTMLLIPSWLLVHALQLTKFLEHLGIYM